MTALQPDSWLSATPNASTCSSFMICQCHFTPRCQTRQSNLGSAKRCFRCEAGASVSCRTYDYNEPAIVKR